MKTYVADDTFVTEGRLVLSKCDAGDLASVVLVGEGREGSPAAPNVQQVIFRCQVKLPTRVNICGGSIDN